MPGLIWTLPALPSPLHCVPPVNRWSRRTRWCPWSSSLQPSSARCAATWPRRPTTRCVCGGMLVWVMGWWAWCLCWSSMVAVLTLLASPLTALTHMHSPPQPLPSSLLPLAPQVIAFFTTARLTQYMAALVAAAGIPVLEIHSRKSQARGAEGRAGSRPAAARAQRVAPPASSSPAPPRPRSSPLCLPI